MDIITYQTAEIDRLQMLLRAEHADNVRLRAAVAHLKEAVGFGRMVAETAWQHSEVGSAACGAFATARERIDNATDEADALMLPEAT